MKIVDTKIWLMVSKIKQARIANDLGVSRNLVWLTINGYARNKKVVQWLHEHGCPEHLLRRPAEKKVS